MLMGGGHRAMENQMYEEEAKHGNNYQRRQNNENDNVEDVDNGDDNNFGFNDNNAAAQP